MLQVENTLFTIVMISYFASMIGYFIYITAKKDIFYLRKRQNKETATALHHLQDKVQVL